MSFKQLLRDSTVSKDRSETLRPCSGILRKLNYDTFTANVEIKNQYGEGTMLVRGAKILTPDKAVKMNSFSLGESVDLDFSGGSLAGARIIGTRVRDDFKKNHTCSNSKLVQNKNNLPFNYGLPTLMNMSGFGEVKSASSELDSIEKTLSSYGSCEVGISNNNDSVVKILENGDILIAAGSGASILICQDGTIELTAISVKNI